MTPFRPHTTEQSGLKSNNLWVGSLTPDTTESDLSDLFGRFGDLDRITAHSSRSFAFIYYRRVEEAVAAKEALQGEMLNGSRIKIEYARPTKPCKSLWVGGISSNVSKDDLEAEFSKFGKIEDFRFLRERRTAFVDYYEVEDALQARSMNGKRVGGSYLRVDFLRSQTQRKEQQWPGSYDNNRHSKGDGPQQSKVLWIGYPPSVQIDEQMVHSAMILFGEIEKIKSYPSKHFSLVEFRSAEEARHAKEGLQGRLFNDPRITITYSNDQIPSDEDDTSLYSGVKRSRPDMFINERSYNGVEEQNWRRPSPTGQGLLPTPARSNHGSWEGYDSAQLDRERKRTRRDGSVDGYTAARPTRGYSETDYIWRGIIAKGGTSVCCARCVPIGKGIQTKLPEVINCSARTGLDMLAKHYTEAIGFEIVFFLPDDEEDFASYTEFLRYLGSKDRAGVAKLGDGTTLFLVPPSDFLTDVLKVSGPERLYGVVLKLAPPPVPVAPTYRQESQSNPLSYLNQSRDSPVNASRSSYTPREDYNRGVPEQSRAFAKPNNAVTQAGVGLTPELLATLASFLPVTSQPTASESHQPMSGTSTVVSTMSQYNVEAPSQAWNRDIQTVHNQSFQQYENQYNPSGQLPPPLPSRYPPVSNTPNYSSGNMQYQGQSLNMPHNSYAMYSQGSSHYPVSQPMTQQYQPEVSLPSQNYGPIPGYQQANYHGLTTNQTHNLNPSQFQAAMPQPYDKLETPSQVQQLQPVLTGAGQGTTDGEGDKNERYQSTLQFAANLLQQIQQKQQQASGAPPAQGP